MLNRGQRKVLTIMFSDIKDFTHYSSTYSPDRIRSFLNEYFESMVDIVFAYNGTLDKYIGDGLMVFFGDPEPLPDHALRAVQAAVAMQKKAAELMQKWLREDGFPLEIRIGINTGEVVVGNMGSSKRLSYTVLGSAVNLAKRLESCATTNGILLSQSTYELIKSAIPTRFFGEIQVKGIEAPVSTYEVIPEDLIADEPRTSGAKQP
jgi:adenylate cyclase